jgi:tetratricopeptide (TPR) repeat protein
MPRPRTDDQLERKIARLGPTKEKADLMIELGQRLFYSKIDRAKTLFEQALELATTLKHRPAIAAAHQSLAGYHGRSDQWRESLQHAEQALELSRQLRNQEGEAIALRLIGEAHITSGDYRQAEQLLNEALALQLKRFDDEGAGYTYSALGFLHWKLLDLEQAHAAYEQARRMFIAGGNRQRLAYITNNLAVIESERGNYAQALTMLEELIPLREKLGDVSGLIETYTNIGNQYAMFANYELALDYMLKSLRLREELNVGRSDYAFNNIAYVYSKLGRLEEAERYYRQALAIAEERGDEADSCDYHSSLASIHLKLGRIDEAIEHARMAVDGAQRLGNAAHAAGGLANLAQAHRLSGDLVHALERIEEAVAVTRSSGNQQHL